MRVVIVGAGFGGIAAAIELRRHGLDDVTILEAGPGLGGTWRENTYPGAACDVPSHMYSYSFAQRRDWSRLCSPQPEILDYLARVAREHDIERRIVAHTRVTDCSWDGRQWSINHGAYTADALIVATGQLHQPVIPDLPGTFAGRSFHTAAWDGGYDLRGKRVAVVGTGASAVQIVPEIAELAGRLTVFQRTGNWMLPRRNRPYPAPLKWAIEHVPGLQSLRRRVFFYYLESLTLAIRNPRTFGRLPRLWSVLFMRLQLRDREVRRKAWPDYTFGCKRVLFSSRYLPALQRSNVELVTERIERLEPHGVAAGGRTYEADCLIYATGFASTRFMFPMEIHGRDGVSLRDAWAEGPHAHLGITVPGFPSLYLMYGPNTNTSGGSIILYLEAQAHYIRQAIERRAVVEVRPEVEAASDRELQARFAGTAWLACDSWYRDASGRIVTNWPGYMSDYLARTREFDPAEYEITPAPR